MILNEAIEEIVDNVRAVSAETDERKYHGNDGYFDII